jgi:Tol biopolymer transport system component
MAVLLALQTLGFFGAQFAQGARVVDGRIAFRQYLNDAQTHGALFTILPDGTGLTQVTHPRRGTVTDEPDWSPNGRWIVYQVENRRGSRLFKMRANGTDKTYLSTGCGRRCGDGYASWFPGGRRLALERESCGTGSNNLIAIYVIRANGTHPRQVTHKRTTCSTSHRYEDGAPAVSPNGKRVAFETFDHKKNKHALFTIRLDGTGKRRVTPWRVDAAQANWSPDGRWIAFRTHEQSEAKGNIGLVRPDGSRFHLITHGHGEQKWLSCAFSPSGEEITAGAAPGTGDAGNADVYIMKIDGSESRNLTNSDTWESAPDWGTNTQ